MESRYALHRGLFNTVCVGLIIAAMYKACAPHSSHPATATQFVEGGAYQQRFCEDSNLNTFPNQNPDHITITLREGCFGNHMRTPLAWARYFIQKSQAQGDWAAVWCEGQPYPSEPRPYYEDMGHTFDGCHPNSLTDEFYLEGKGTITFVRTAQRPEYAAQIGKDKTDGIENKDVSYRLTPLHPKDGDLPDYTFILEECHRERENINCSGLITNTTDAPRFTDLHDSTAVDDEGNSIFIGTFVGGFAFPGVNYFGSQTKLLPGVPTKFVVKIGDPHQNVKSMNLALHVNGGDPYRYDTLIFKDVPVQ